VRHEGMKSLPNYICIGSMSSHMHVQGLTFMAWMSTSDVLICETNGGFL